MKTRDPAEHNAFMDKLRDRGETVTQSIIRKESVENLEPILTRRAQSIKAARSKLKSTAKEEEETAVLAEEWDDEQAEERKAQSIKDARSKLKSTALLEEEEWDEQAEEEKRRAHQSIKLSLLEEPTSYLGKRKWQTQEMEREEDVVKKMEQEGEKVGEEALFNKFINLVCSYFKIHYENSDRFNSPDVPIITAGVPPLGVPVTALQNVAYLAALFCTIPKSLPKAFYYNLYYDAMHKGKLPVTFLVCEPIRTSWSKVMVEKEEKLNWWDEFRKKGLDIFVLILLEDSRIRYSNNKQPQYVSLMQRLENAMQSGVDKFLKSLHKLLFDFKSYLNAGVNSSKMNPKLFYIYELNYVLEFLSKFILFFCLFIIYYLIIADINENWDPLQFQEWMLSPSESVFLRVDKCRCSEFMCHYNFVITKFVKENLDVDVKFFRTYCKAGKCQLYNLLTRLSDYTATEEEKRNLWSYPAEPCLTMWEDNRQPYIPLFVDMKSHAYFPLSPCCGKNYCNILIVLLCIIKYINVQHTFITLT